MQISLFSNCRFLCEHRAHALLGPGTVSGPGTAACITGMASRVENHAALGKLVPRLYLGSRPALML